MTQERFLELLNKAGRSPEEEVELKTELDRQAAEAKPASEQAQASESVTPTEAVQPEVPVEPSPSEVPAEPKTQVEPEVNEPYTLEQLDKELQEATAFVKTHNPTLAVEMAIAGLTQASYWIKQASAGK